LEVVLAANRIEAVIFDWGGVLIDDPRPGLMKYCAKAFGIPKEEYIETHIKFLERFQEGSISEQGFWAKVSSELGRPKPKLASLWGEAFRAAYHPRKEMFDLVVRLHDAGYKTALLSNTEVPAMEFFHELKYPGFDVLVFSCEEGIAKPKRKAYEITLERLGTPAARTVFIDDRASLIEGAEQVGIKTILFKSIGQIKEELARLGVKTD
jgi:epoxide hydrolase-like predicted phosphatase